MQNHNRLMCVSRNVKKGKKTIASAILWSTEFEYRSEKRLSCLSPFGLYKCIMYTRGPWTATPALIKVYEIGQNQQKNTCKK